MGEIHLSDAEWEIMNCLWNKPNQKISEIVIALSEKKAWDKHTVITLLNRMEKKGAVSFERWTCQRVLSVNFTKRNCKAGDRAVF